MNWWGCAIKVRKRGLQRVRAAVYDLKAANPDGKVEDDERTPAESWFGALRPGAHPPASARGRASAFAKASADKSARQSSFCAALRTEMVEAAGVEP